MKKILLFASLMFSTQFVHADIFDLMKSREVHVHFTTSTALSGTFASLLIDASDITNFPHKQKNGEIHLTNISLDIDKVGTTTTTARIGVVTYVDASTGSVTWFASNSHLLNEYNSDRHHIFAYPDEGLNTKVIPATIVAGGNNDGTTPFIISNEKTTGSTVYQNDVSLFSVFSSSIAPALGDIVFEYAKTGGTVNFAIDLRYYTK